MSFPVISFSGTENARLVDSPMKPPLRIAILECDTPLAGTRHKYGGYGGVFKALLEAGADALGQPDVISSKKGLELTKWDVEREEHYPRPEEIDAILITGSSKLTSGHSHARLF